ncbi:MAG: Crp/Fnr family transcriptional regulator [Oscillospiraceae bacterium]|nr:Crp/Fnr family transcriptional regulator [Oscillospiraceae bacterium]
MNIKTFSRGEIIFREGDAGDCVYELSYGRVGIYANYGKENEQKISELIGEQFFGEMGLLEHAPRSATAVALEEGTCVDAITEDNFNEFFKENPAKVLMMIQQMCHRLRRTTDDYLEVCRTAHDVVTTEKAGKQQPLGLKASIRKFCEFYKELLGI